MPRAGLSRPSALNLSEVPSSGFQSIPGVPPFLSSLTYWDAIELFQRFDCDGNRSLEVTEFARFICTMFPKEAAVTSSRLDAPALFQMVNRSKSGHVSIEEFLAWIYSVPPRLSPNRPETPTSPFQMTPTSPLSPPSRATSSNSPASPTSPTSRPRSMGRSQSTGSLSRSGSMTLPPLSPKMGQRHGRDGKGKFARPLVLEFTYGPDFEWTLLNPSRIAELCKLLKFRLGHLIHVRKVPDPLAIGCSKCVAGLGSGITVWDRTTMMMYRGDPFETFQSIDAWVNLLKTKIVPLLFRVMDL